MKHNEFDYEEKYKLYRNVGDLLHPTISKKNISNYRIIISDDCLPLRIFYPTKVSNLRDVFIYIHGEEKITNCKKKYAAISTYFAKNYNRLVISIDYDNYTNLNLKKLNILIYSTIKKIYIDLINNNIFKENITLVGDSTSASTILFLTRKMNKENIEFGKYLLFYPPVSGKYSINKLDANFDIDLFPKLKLYYKGVRKSLFPINDKEIRYPETLILCGKIDPLLEEINDFVNMHKEIKLKVIPFANHGFLGTDDKEIINEYNNFIIKFLNK